jgi:hypothetical protein
MIQASVSNTPLLVVKSDCCRLVVRPVLLFVARPRIVAPHEIDHLNIGICARRTVDGFGRSRAELSRHDEPPGRIVDIEVGHVRDLQCDDSGLLHVPGLRNWMKSKARVVRTEESRARQLRERRPQISPVVDEGGPDGCFLERPVDEGAGHRS